MKVIFTILSLMFFNQSCGVDCLSELLQRNVDKQIPIPGHKVNAAVHMKIHSISGIHLPEAVFHMEVFYRQSWIDKRLAWNSTELTGPITIKVFKDMSDIWVPDGAFFNAKSVVFHDLPTPNSLLRVRSDGSVYYSQRLTITIPCKMDVRRYPFDVQRCPVVIESYSYIYSQLVFSWVREHGNPVVLGSNADTQTHFVKTGPIFEEEVAVYLSGNYSRIKFHLLFERQPLKTLLNDFFPTIFLVILSWANFWIDVNCIPARTSLCITIVLAHITKAGSMLSQMPEVTYVTSQDTWLLICITSHFLVLAEFTIAHVMTRRHVAAQRTDVEGKVWGASVTGYQVDRISRVAFPAVFVTVTSAYLAFVITKGLSPVKDA